MSSGRSVSGSFFSLFNGEITGSVTNPVTGNKHSRKEVLDHYKYLIKRSIEDPADVRLRRLIRLIADLLEIPHDIHDQLIVEAWKDQSLIGDVKVRPFVKADMEAMYNLMTGDTFIDKGSGHRGEGRPSPMDKERRKARKMTTHGLFDDHGGIFDEEDVSTYSLISEMEEEDISIGPSSGVLDNSRDSPLFSVGWKKRPGGGSID